MLIRSQDRETLTNMNLVADLTLVECMNGVHKIKAFYPNTEDGKTAYLYLAEYSTKEKALKVLDMIENKYLSYRKLENAYGGVHGIFNLPKVFHMPADEDVEV